MSTYTVTIGNSQDLFAWDTSDVDSNYYDDDTTPYQDDVLGTFYGIKTNARVSFAGIDLTGSDADDPISFNNNVAIKWKTTAGNRRPMLKLNDSDHFVIGSSNADAADQIDFNISGQNDVFNLKDDGYYAERTGRDSIFRLGSDAGYRRTFSFRTAGVTRWHLGVDATAESGSNAGSLFILEAYSDTGVLIDTVLSIVRAAGGLATWRRDLEVLHGTGNSTVYIGRPAGADGRVIFRTGNSARWTFGVESTAESGSNAGSNLIINAYSDTGVFIDSPMSIERATTGLVRFFRQTSVGLGKTGAVLVLGDGTTSGEMDLDIKGLAGQNRYVRFLSGSTLKFRFGVDTAEGGSDAGANLGFYAYDDSGTLIDVPLRIFRIAAGNVAISRPVLLDSNSTQAIFRTSRASGFLLDTNMTTLSAFQAMTSGSFGATTGTSTFRHDVVAGDGSGTNFLAINGGSSSGNESDLIFQAAGANKWYNYILGNAPGTIRWFFTGMTNDSMSLATDATYAADFRLGYNAAKHVLMRFNRNSGSYVAQQIYSGTVATANLRWLEYLGDSTAESGSNRGTNRVVYRYMDDGTTNYHLLTQRRSDGYWFTGTLLRWIVDTEGRTVQRSLDLDARTYDWDDFFAYSNLTTQYYITTAGIGDSVTRVQSDGCGVMYLKSDSVSAIVTRSDGTPHGDYKTANLPWFECRVKAATGEDEVRVGLVSESSGNGITFRKLPAHTTWYICTGALDTTATNTSITTSSWHVLRFNVISSTQAQIYIDDTLITTLTIALSTSDMLYPMFKAVKTTATGAHLYVDYWRASQVRA